MVEESKECVGNVKQFFSKVVSAMTFSTYTIKIFLDISQYPMLYLYYKKLNKQGG